MTERSLAEKVEAVRRAGGASFTQLVAIAGLDRSKAFRFADFSGVDLRDQDLSGFDFTGADFRLALVEGASFRGAVINGAEFANGDIPEVSGWSPDDFASAPLAELVRLLRRLSHDGASDVYAILEAVGRSHPTLLAELIRLAPSEHVGIGFLRRFFPLHWSGTRAHPILRNLVAMDYGPAWLAEAMDITGYTPSGPTQVEMLLKCARSFDAANTIYQRFERFCTSQHLILLGRHVRSPTEYTYLRQLAGRFSNGLDQQLIALRALPSVQMIRFALDHFADSDVAQLPQMRVIFAEKVQGAGEALDLLQDMGAGVRVLKQILTASLGSLGPEEALRLVRLLMREDTPIHVGGSIWTELLVTLYLKRSDLNWRLSVYREFLQRHLDPVDLGGRRIHRMIKFSDLVELAAMVAAAHGFDMERELLPLAKSHRDMIALQSGTTALQQTGGREEEAIIKAFRAILQDARRDDRRQNKTGKHLARI